MSIYICHRLEIQDKEKTMQFVCSHSNCELWWWCWQMGRQTMAFPLHMCSGFPMEKVEQMIVTLFYDVIMISHAVGGGKYIRKVSMSLGAVIWVSGTEWLGQLPRSHQPSTLAISVPLMEQEYILDELCALFIYLPVPRLLWEPFS